MPKVTQSAFFFSRRDILYLTAGDGDRAGCVIVYGVCKIVGEIRGDISIGGLALARQLLQVLWNGKKFVVRKREEVTNGEK